MDHATYKSIYLLQKDINNLIFASQKVDKELSNSILKKLHEISDSEYKSNIYTYYRDILDNLLGEAHQVDNIADLKNRVETHASQIVEVFSHSMGFNNIQQKKCLELLISDQQWDKLEHIGVTRPQHDHVFVRGGNARSAGKILLNPSKKLTQQDYETCKDVDLLVVRDGSKNSLSHNDLISYYGADSEGISYTPCLYDDTGFKRYNVDCDCNEALLHRNGLLYTEDFQKFTQTDITTINFLPPSLYKIPSYTHQDSDIKILDATQLIRGFKLLIEGKVTGIRLPADQLYKNNLLALNIGNEFITIDRKIAQKTINNKNMQIELYYKMGLLLTDLQILHTPEELFNFIQSQKQLNKKTTTTQKDHLFDLKRKFTKLNDWIFRKHFGAKMVVKNQLYNYQLGDNTIITYSPDLSGEPSHKFIEEMEKIFL